MAVAVDVCNAVAIVVSRADGAFLTVRRPKTDPYLPDVWGLPAINVNDGESSEDAAVRAAKEKLGIVAKVRRRVGCETVARPDFALHLTEFEIDVLEGCPQVPQRNAAITQYVEARYTDDVSLLADAARQGSACCRIFLRDHDYPW